MNSLPTPYQEFIYKRSYSRWLPDQKRRENWPETVQRYADFFRPRVPINLMGEFEEAIQAILRLDVMPSMRCMWAAGPALEYDNIAGYNCAYTQLDSIKTFAEILYILMNGTGIGVSVERQFIAKLPSIPGSFKQEGRVVFADSKKGWAEGFLKYLQHLYWGFIPQTNLSKIRPKGSRLKTFGGRASGPEPLQDLLDFTLNIFKKAQGRKLNSEECADIVCKTAEIVVVGGVRRSAILLLTNPSDRRMMNYKQGEFWLTNPQRALANISACYTEKPDPVTFLEDFIVLMKSGTGERGIVNREALQGHVEPLRDSFLDYGVNPCGEIILRPRQFCNLTEVVCRPTDTHVDLVRKIRSASLLGTLQATLSKFRFLGPEWQRNTEEERLLGVSLTGLLDVFPPPTFEALRNEAKETNKRWADALGIPPAKGVTCIKPSGTVSQLVGASSGIHPRFSAYYLRRVRVASSDPLAAFLIASGVPWEPENGETRENCKTVVFGFPCVSPKTSLFRSDVTALEQLKYWLKVKQNYTDHNPSVTIYVKEAEWVSVAGWLYEHWQYLGGITLLPYDGGVYKLAPYEEISEEKYLELEGYFPCLDFDRLEEFEYDDSTEGSREYACVGGSCEL